MEYQQRSRHSPLPLLDTTISERPPQHDVQVGAELFPNCLRASLHTASRGLEMYRGCCSKLASSSSPTFLGDICLGDQHGAMPLHYSPPMHAIREDPDPTILCLRLDSDWIRKHQSVDSRFTSCVEKVGEARSVRLSEDSIRFEGAGEDSATEHS
jgi:hypothetical protein